MIVDTSPVVAVLLKEPGFEVFLQALSQVRLKRMAAPTLLELTMVMIGRKATQGPSLVDDFLRAAEIEVIPFSADHAAVARQAFLRYGKGRHPAGLNFGDCIAYATARLEAMPLLFKDEEFRLTDIESAV